MRLGKCSLPSMIHGFFLTVRSLRPADNTSVRVTPTQKGEPDLDRALPSQKTAAPPVPSGHYTQGSSAAAFWPAMRPDGMASMTPPS